MSREFIQAGRSGGNLRRVLAAAIVAVVGMAVGISGASVASAVSSPTITKVSPASLPQGATHAPVTLTGTNFQSGAKVVSHSGIHAAVTFVSSTQLNLAVTVATTVVPGAYNLDLTNPDGGKFNCKGCLTVTGTSLPTVTSVSPNTVDQNSTTTGFSITGTNFASGATVTFSASGVTGSAVTFVSSTSLTATVTVSSTAALGPSDVTVTTNAGSGTCKSCLTVAAGNSPTITGLNPNTLPQGATNSPATLTGTHFESGATVVSHTGITLKATFVSSTQLNLSVTVASSVTPGPYNLDLTNPDNGKAICTGCLTVTGPGANWSAYLNGPQHSSYNPSATSITPSNIGSLEPAWRWLPPNDVNHNKLFASPIVVNGVVYAGSYNGWLYAVSEATQSILWQQFLGVVKGVGASGCGSGKTGIIATPTVTTDPGTGRLAVYENAPDGHLYALDAATGTVLWTGVVGIPSTTQNDYFAWGSPLVANGKIYVGISSQCDNPLVQGGLVAFTQDSATSNNPPAATWHTLPDSVMCQPPQTTPGCGGSIWSSPAVANDGSIIVTTGNGPPTATSCANNPPDSSSVVKLDPNTLTVEHVFGIPPGDVGNACDIDWGGSPTMFTATVNGVSTPMVGGCDKNGHFYGLRQSDLSMVWDYVMGTQNQPGGAQQCDAAAIWDGTHLIEASGSPTTVGGTQYQVASLYPASGSADGSQTGKPIWQTNLPGNIVGSPSEDGAGVVAAPVYVSSTGQQGVYLLSAATGAVLGFVPTPNSVNFGQPVWAGNDLLVGAGTDVGLTAWEISQTGPAITNVSPNTLTHGTTATLTITGSGFGSNPHVIFTNTLVNVEAVTVTSPTTLSVKVAADTTAPLGAANIVVSQAGAPPTADTCSNCLTIN